MASIKYHCNINLQKNEIENAVVHKLAAAPSSPIIGQVYFNTTVNRLFVRLATGWKDITGYVDSLSSTTTALTITDNGDGTLTLAIADANGTNSGLLSVAFFNDLTGATSAATPNTLVKRDANGDASFGRVTADDITITNAPVNPTDAANKAYIDGLIANGMDIIGGITASSNPNYPSATKGDAYYMTAAGLIGGASGEQVEVGDLIVALNTNGGGDQATVGADWLILQRNVDQADNVQYGIVRKATLTEAQNGTGDGVIDAATLQSVLSGITTTKYTQVFGDGVSTTFTINHSLGTIDLGNVLVLETATSERVQVCWSIVDANNISIEVNTALATNSHKVIVSA